MKQIVALNNGSGLYATRIFEKGDRFVLQSLYDGEVLVESGFDTLSEATKYMVLNWFAEYDDGAAFLKLNRALQVG